ncbi:MAG: MXAN_6640 family putative metalloprotease [Candidatus Zixiibacteriota bacterium]
MANPKAKLVLLALAGILLLNAAVRADNAPLSVEDQRALIANYMFATGQHGSGISASVEGHDTIPIKCGMSAVADFVLNRDRIDSRLMAAMGAKLSGRPALDLSYISPGGHFKIHYTKSGIDSVYQASQDANSNGVPNFVESVAAICDSVWNHHINLLGYPVPPSDSFYSEGDGPQFDVYLHDLIPDYFGLSYLDSTQIDGAGTTRATSFMELDNDYQQIATYKDRPLDAVRVTVAHEFFHSIQFGIDFSEAEVTGSGSGTIVRRYWMEMSAVWMEEQTYTSINDYYAYLPSFFNFPMASLQRFRLLSDNHPYGAVVFPLYLSQKFGPRVIKDIWLKCGQLGAGPDFLVAANAVIDSASNHTMNWAKAFREFALWNYFTGSGDAGRAAIAPPGVGYTEGANYPIIPDSVDVFQGGTIVTIPEIDIVTNYPRPPSVQPYNFFALRPEHNAASYIRLEKINTLVRYWANRLNADSSGVCAIQYVDTVPVFTDSSLLHYRYGAVKCPPSDTLCYMRSGCTDTTLVRVDDTVTVLVYTGSDLGGQNWGLNIVYRYTSDFGVTGDSVTVDTFSLPSNVSAFIFMKRPQQFQSATMILTPATADLSLYTPDTKKNVGYFIDESIDETYGYDSALVNLPAAVLTPYPNPAVVASMGGKQLTFRFQMPTDISSLPNPSGVPTISVDIYNAAGERVQTLKEVTAGNQRAGTYQASWDMKNAAGNDVVSGVYIAVARLYSSAADHALLAESKAKVLIVR